MEADGVDIYGISIPPRLCTDVCLGLHDSKILLGAITENKTSIKIYDLSKNVEIASINIARENIRRIRWILIGTCTLSYLVLTYLLIAIFLSLGQETIMATIYKLMLLSIVFMPLIFFMIQIFVGLESYLRPSIAYDPTGRFVLVYKDGIIGHFDINERKLTWRKVHSISAVSIDLINAASVVILTCIAFPIPYLILYTDIIYYLDILLLFFIFIVVCFIIFFSVVQPALFRQTENVKIFVGDGYVGFLCPGILDRGKIVITDRDWNVIRKFTIRMRRSFLWVIRPKGFILDRSSNSLICWDFFELYRIDLMTGRKVKLISVRKLPTLREKMGEDTAHKTTKTQAYFWDFIESVCWLREGESILLATCLGRIYSVSMDGEAKLVGSLVGKICHMARLGDKIYLAISG